MEDKIIQAAACLTRTTQGFLPEGQWRAQQQGDDELLFTLVDAQNVPLAVPFASYLVLNTSFAEAGFVATRKAGLSDFSIPNADLLPEGTCGFFHFWSIIGDAFNVNAVFALEKDKLDLLSEREGFLREMIAAEALDKPIFERKLESDRQGKAVLAALNHATAEVFPEWFWRGRPHDIDWETVFVPCDKTSWHEVSVDWAQRKKLYLAFASVGVGPDLYSVRSTPVPGDKAEDAAKIYHVHLNKWKMGPPDYTGERHGSFLYTLAQDEDRKGVPTLTLPNDNQPWFSEKSALLRERMDRFCGPVRVARHRSFDLTQPYQEG